MIANQFNKYFTFIAKPMIENLVKRKHKCYKYLRNPNINSFFISLTNDKVLSVIKVSYNKSMTASISRKVLIFFQIVTSKLMSTITNLSFSSGSFPNNIKITK